MYKKIMGILFLLFLCFPVAMAVTYEYTGSITADLGSAQITSDGAPGTAASAGFNESYDWITMRIDYDTVGTPELLLMYSSNDVYAVGTGGFNLYDIHSHLIGSGTLAVQNGTGMYGGSGKQYYLFTFTSWTGYTNTGQSNAIMYVPNTGISRGAGQSIFYAIQKGFRADAVFGVDGGGGMASTFPGMIYQQKQQLIDVSYQVDKTGGTGLGTISTVNVTRNPGNTVATNVRAVRIENASALRYYSPYTTSILADYFIVDQDNYVISLYSPFTGLTYNSSVIFPPGYTPTPNTTPTPTTTPAPSGYTRTTLFATDGSTGGKIIGASLSVRDVQNNSWFNSTSSMAGSIVDVISGHTLDIYGSYPGTYTPSLELGAVAGGDYYLPLMPPIPTPPIGYVNVIINLQDSRTHLIVPSASVSFRLPTGATTVESTGAWGTAQTVQPNNTVIIIGASKSGYQSISISLNSGTGPDVVRTLQLTKNVVSTPTPTVTDPGTGVIITPVPTILPGCTDPNSDDCKNSQDSNLMAILRDNGPMIVNLSITAVIFGLIGMIFSGMTRWGK